MFSEKSSPTTTSARLLMTLQCLLELSVTNRGETLHKMAQLIAQALEGAEVVVFLYDAANRSLTAQGTSMTSLGDKVKTISLDGPPLEDGGRIAEVYRTGQSYCNGQARHDPIAPTEMREEPGSKSEMAVPIEVDTEQHGVLFAASRHPHSFTGQDLCFLEAVGYWIGVVLHRTKQEEQQIRAERTQIEDTLREQAALLQLADDAFVVHDEQNRASFWSQGATILYGWSEQEVVGKVISDLLHTQFPLPLSEILTILRREGSWQGELEDIARNGKHVIIDSRWHLIGPQEGSSLRILEVNRDITEHKRAEEQERLLYHQAQQARNQLEVILQGVADGIVVYASESKIIYANETAAQMNGYASVQELLEAQQLGMPRKLEMIDEKGRPLPPSQLTHQRVFAGERECQAMIGYRDGTSESWSLVKSRPVLDERGYVTMVISILHDLTERMRLENRKNEFISMASHELKTPVTSLKGFTQILQRRLIKQGDKQGLHYLARMDAQLDRLTNLISDLLDISRIEAGKLVLRAGPFDLDELIDETVENVQAMTSTHRLLVEGRTGMRMLGDKDRLGQVVVNLLTNAIKYSPGANMVLVRLSRDGEQAIVSVQDFGIGIDKAHHENLFERFYRVTDPEEKTYSGLGIGLYISREIVKRHHGRTWVESSPGKGSTFFVALPGSREWEKGFNAENS